MHWHVIFHLQPKKIKKLGGSQTPILAHFAFQLAHCAPVPGPGGEIIFPTAVPDPQYELICIQPIRDDSPPPPPRTYDMNIHDLRLRNLRVRMCVDLLFYCGEEIKRGKIEYASIRVRKLAYNQIYVQWMATSDCHTNSVLCPYCALIQRPLSLILNNYAG